VYKSVYILIVCHDSDDRKYDRCELLRTCVIVIGFRVVSLNVSFYVRACVLMSWFVQVVFIHMMQTNAGVCLGAVGY